MKNIVNFPKDPDVRIEIQRTPELVNAIRTLSDFIKGLPLSNSNNEYLVQLLCIMVEAAESGAYKQGLELGLEINGD